METEIVLFLQEDVPEAALETVLAEVFDIAPDAGDTPLVVRYEQGFAIGVSVPCDGTLSAECAAGSLCSRLGMPVLLESCPRLHERAQWLLFAPGTPDPFEVEVVELRYGLDVATPVLQAAPIREQVASGH
jgi:hypothetical protein